MLNPGPAQVHYRDYFADPANDVFDGNYADVLLPYSVPGLNHTAAEVRTLACNCRSQQVPTAFVLLHSDDLLLHVYVQLDKFSPRMGLPVTQWDNNMYIGKGELVHNNQVLVQWNNAHFNQSAQVRVPSTASILTTYAADPTANILGPYTATDADTELVTPRRTCFVPPLYVPLLLNGPLTPRQAWETIYGQIVNDGREDMCLPFVNFLRCAITTTTRNQAPPVAQVPPTAPLADALLLQRRRQVLENDFPSLNTNLFALQQNQIATQLGQLVTKTRATREALPFKMPAKHQHSF